MAGDDDRGETPREGLWRARLLDLRSYLAALFAVFGSIVLISGITASPAQIAKARGMNLSLWTGVAMLVFALVFLVWLLRAPPEVPEPTAVATPEDVDDVDG